MSKSYGNVLPLFGETELHKLIRRFKTDSTAPDEPKDPETTGLFQPTASLPPDPSVKAPCGC